MSLHKSINLGNNPSLLTGSRDNPHKESMEDALRRAGWLRGFRVDGVFEPRISAHQVASYMNGAEPLIEEGMDTLSTEIYISKNEREANYFQRGWPLEATTGISPWTSSRITANNQPNGSGTWYTKMTKAKRVKVEALLQDLVPAPEFLKAIEKALTEPTVFEKFQAVYLTLSRWGDVVPLEIEIGSSITLTSNHVDCVQPSEIDERNFSNIAQFLKIKDASVAITGAGPSITYDQRSAIQDLASNPQWKRISVNKVVPIINLLPCDLQTRLSELYAQRLCCVPPDGVGPVNQHCKTYDDYKHASRTISSIKTRCSYVIELLSITYADGVISNNHGGGGHVGAEYEFTLDTNEHITEMLIWIEGTWLYGLQFITSMGRCSDQYGIHRGTPTVARCKGGVLVGFISHTKLHPDFKELFHQVQGIWRRDLVPKVPKEDDVYSDYFGNIKQDGKNFNDRVIVGNSTSMRISSIEVWSSEQIDSIKFTYTDIIDGQERTSTTNRRGGPGGLYHKFMLENGEHVVTVSGRHEEAHITQLCFVTNRGRTSEVFGGGNGQSFSVLSPRDKSGNCFRLQYVCGKSTDKLLASIMFVWTPC